MPTNYPGAIDSYTVKTPHVSPNAAADVNNLQDAVVAIETKLGTTASPTPSHVSTLTVDGAATFTAGPVVIGTDPGGTQLLRVGGTGHFSGALTLDAGLTVSAGGANITGTSLPLVVTESTSGGGVRTLLQITGGGTSTDPAIALVNTAAGGVTWSLISSGGGSGLGNGTFSIYSGGAQRLGISPSGAVNIPAGGLTVSAGGLTVSAGGLTVSAGGLTVSAGGLGVGTAAVAGQLSLSDGSNSTIVGAGSLNINATTDMYIRAGAANSVRIQQGNLLVVNNVGFYNTAPVAKQTVTGSRGGNAALASLLTALAATGLLADSSTV